MSYITNEMLFYAIAIGGILMAAIILLVAHYEAGEDVCYQDADWLRSPLFSKTHVAAANK